MDYTHVEEDLASVCDLVELANCVFELIIVIASKSRNPRLDFLGQVVSMFGLRKRRRSVSQLVVAYLLQRHGCDALRSAACET